jgi:predicted PurR-regulated permease PerM
VSGVEPASAEHEAEHAAGETIGAEDIFGETVRAEDTLGATVRAEDTLGDTIGAEDAEQARAAEDVGRFGRPGQPLARSPFVVGLTAGLGLVLAYSAYLMVKNALSILVLIFIAMFLAIGLNPAVVRLQRLGLRRGIAVALVGLGTVLLFCGGIFALVPPLISQGNELIGNLPNYIDDLQRNQSLRELNEQYDILDRVRTAATPGNITKAIGGVWGGAQFIFGALFNLLTIFVLTIYFMGAFDRVKAGAYRLVPASRRERITLIGDEILTKVGAYMAGALSIALIAGTSTFIFLVVAGVAYPYALAVVVAVTDLIPQIGATLGAVVVSVVGFATSIPVGVACVIFFICYQQMENFLIYPKVMRRAVKVSDLAAIIAALLGISLLGVVGALIAIPAVAAIQLIVREVVFPRQERH